jgi:hypothetical protein
MIPKTIMLKVEETEQKERPDRKFPLVTLCGAWLEKAGFLPEDSAMVAIYRNTLIIRPVKNDTNE